MELKVDPSHVFKCFVVMPFSDAKHLIKDQPTTITAAEWNHIFKYWIKKAVESYKPHKFRCMRSPAVPGNFIKGIIHDIYESELVIADLTGSKPNVYYELGIRHALGPGTLIITQDLDAIPSDLRSYYCFQYDYTKAHPEYERRYKAFEEELHKKIKHFFDELFPSDNPVSDFLGYKHAFLEDRFRAEKLQLEILFKMCQSVVKENYAICEDLNRMANHLKSGNVEEFEFKQTPILDFFPFDLCLSRFLNTNWDLLPSDSLENVGFFLHTMRMKFLPIHQAWQRLQINPSSEANQGFFELVSAVLEDRSEFEQAIDALLSAIPEIEISMTIGSKQKAAQESKSVK